MAKISKLHLAIMLLAVSACVVAPAGYYDGGAGPYYPNAGYYGYGPAVYPWNSGIDVDIIGGWGHGGYGRGYGGARGGGGFRGGGGHGGGHGGGGHR